MRCLYIYTTSSQVKVKRRGLLRGGRKYLKAQQLTYGSSQRDEGFKRFVSISVSECKDETCQISSHLTKINVKGVHLTHLFVADSNCSCFSRELIASSSFPIWKYDLSMRRHRQIPKFISLGVSSESGYLLASTGREFFPAKSIVCSQSFTDASYFSSCSKI